MTEPVESTKREDVCECGLDLSMVNRRKPDITVTCLHDGQIGISLYKGETPVPVVPGDLLEVQWRLDFPTDGGVPKLYEVGREDGPRKVREDNGNRANAGQRPDSGADSGTSLGTGEGTSVVPDGFEPLRGYRAWKKGDDGLLHSTGQAHTWSPTEPEEAICQSNKSGHHVSLDLFRMREEAKTMPEGNEKAALTASIDREIMNARRSPERNCMCGIYAVTEPEEIEKRVGTGPDLIYGRVKAWGKIAEYSNGFRSEFAEIECLFTPRGPLGKRKVKKIAKKYGVPTETEPFHWSRGFDPTDSFSIGAISVLGFLIGGAAIIAGANIWGYLLSVGLFFGGLSGVWAWDRHRKDN